MGGGIESRCVGRVYGADGAVHGNIRITSQLSRIMPTYCVVHAGKRISSHTAQKRVRNYLTVL